MRPGKPLLAGRFAEAAELFAQVEGRRDALGGEPAHHLQPVHVLRRVPAVLTGRVLEWQWVRAFSPFVNMYAVVFLIGGDDPHIARAAAAIFGRVAVHDLPPASALDRWDLSQPHQAPRGAGPVSGPARRSSTHLQ